MTPEKIVQTIFGVTAAVVAFLLAQQDVPLDPIAKVILGAISVGVAVANPWSVAQKAGGGE